MGIEIAAAFFLRHDDGLVHSMSVRDITYALVYRATDLSVGVLGNISYS